MFICFPRLVSVSCMREASPDIIDETGGHRKIYRNHLEPTVWSHSRWLYVVHEYVRNASSVKLERTKAEILLQAHSIVGLIRQKKGDRLQTVKMNRVSCFLFV